MYTDRLLINELTREDKEDYFINISHDKKVLETFICKYQETIEEFNFDIYLNRKDIYAIRLKETNKLIGILTMFDNDGNKCEIGYGIGSKYWNNGYTSEAVKEFIKFLFNTTSVNTIYASYFTGNIASKRVMEKTGMVYSHFVKEELEYLGVKRDLTYYKITRN